MKAISIEDIMRDLKIEMFDTIEIDIDVLNQTSCDAIKNADINEMVSVLKTPAVEEFQLKITGTNSKQPGKILYTKPNPKLETILEDFVSTNFIYILDEDATFINSIYNIGYNPKTNIVNYGLMYPLNMNEDVMLQKFGSTLVDLYITIQLLIKNKPTVMKEVGTRVSNLNKNNKHKKTRKSKNKIKITKILRIQNNEVQDFLKEHSTHKITCPSWGVSGHYRHYKNGKVVWIKPYKKGKKRDSNKDYQSKTYSI